MMRGRLIGKGWPPMQRICATWLVVATSPSVPHQTGYPALIGPWRRFEVIRRETAQPEQGIGYAAH